MFMRLLYCFIALLLKLEISLRLGQTDIYATGKMHASKPRSIFLFPQIRSTRAATLCYNCVTPDSTSIYIHTVSIYPYTCMSCYCHSRGPLVIFMQDPLRCRSNASRVCNISLTCDVGEEPTSRSLVMAQADSWSRILL